MTVVVVDPALSAAAAAAIAAAADRRIPRARLGHRRRQDPRLRRPPSAAAGSKERGSDYETGEHSEWVPMAHEDEQFLFGASDEGVYYPGESGGAAAPILVAAGAVVLAAGLPLEAVTALRVVLDREGGHFVKLIVPSAKDLHLTVAAALLLPEIAWDRPRPTQESGQLPSAGGGPGSPRCVVVSGVDSREAAIVDAQLRRMGFGRVPLVRVAPRMINQKLGEVVTRAAEEERRVQASNLDLRERHRQRKARMTAAAAADRSSSDRSEDDGKQDQDQGQDQDQDQEDYFRVVSEAESEFTKLDISEFGKKMVELAELSDEELDRAILEERQRIHQAVKRKLGEEGRL